MVVAPHPAPAQAAGGVSAGSISPPPAGPAAIEPEIQHALGLSDSQTIGLGVAAMVLVVTLVMWARSVLASRLRPAPVAAPLEEAPAAEIDALPGGFEPTERQVYSPPPMKAPWETDQATAEAPEERPGGGELPAPEAAADPAPGADYLPAFVPPPVEE